MHSRAMILLLMLIKCFKNIETQLPTKEEPKRRIGFWLLGCGGVIGLMAISILLYSQFEFEKPLAKVNTPSSTSPQLNAQKNKIYSYSKINR